MVMMGTRLVEICVMKNVCREKSRQDDQTRRDDQIRRHDMQENNRRYEMGSPSGCFFWKNRTSKVASLESGQNLLGGRNSRR